MHTMCNELNRAHWIPTGAKTLPEPEYYSCKIYICYLVLSGICVISVDYQHVYHNHLFDLI